MLKILKVCTSEFLPPIKERNSNYIYFVYDKMSIYLGQNFYSDPFCIVEALPSKPIEGMLYITIEGSVKTFIDSKEVLIAIIENEDQIEYLKQAGTIYFMKAEYRYLDQQSRLLNLPFQNGNYQLSVQAANNLKIDKDTVIKFNPLTSRFEIFGNKLEYPDQVYRNGYIGSETDTVKTEIYDNNHMRSDVKISSEAGNILEVFGGGLYANIGDLATEESLNNLALLYENYKETVESKMQTIRDEMQEKGFTLTEESLGKMIMDALVDYEPTIQEMLDNYDTVYEQLGYLREGTKNYADEKIDVAKQEIENYIMSVSSSWSEFDTYSDDTEAVDYYTEDEKKIIADALAKARLEIMEKRDLETYTNVDVSAFVISDNEGITSSDITLLPKTIVANSEIGGKIGYTFILVSTNKISDTNSYWYKVTDTVPKDHEVLDGYILWDGKSQLKIPDGSHIILVEANTGNEALRYTDLEVKSRLENPKELDVINISSTEGSITGTTNLVFSPTIEDGHMYMYKEATTIPEYNSILSDDYKEYNIKEFDSSYDSKQFTIVECTKDYHRALKIGIVTIDTAMEKLQNLTFTTDYSEDILKCLTTHITGVFPKKDNNNSYKYKLRDGVLPLLNSLLTGPEWKPYNLGDIITLNDFTDEIVVAEVDDEDRAKRAGIVIDPRIDNNLDVIATYNINEYMRNHINYQFYEGTSLYYYNTKDIGEIITHIDYDYPIDEMYIKANSTNDVDIVENRQLALAEVFDGTNKVRRFTIIDPVIAYAQDISSDLLLSVNDDMYTISGLPYYLNYRYYIQLMSVEDDKKYILNETIDTDKFIIWDGYSPIQISDTTNVEKIKVVITDIDNRIQYIGKTEL